MKVTLRKFLDITEANFAYSTSLYVTNMMNCLQSGIRN